jgi:hypothetical protein
MMSEEERSVVKEIAMEFDRSMADPRCREYRRDREIS